MSVRIVPPLEVKPFKECEPGSLVRLSQTAFRLGLTAGSQERPLFVGLANEADEPQPPVYDTINGFQEVLSYGTDFLIVPDLNNRREFPVDTLADSPGVLVFALGKPHLTVQSREEHVGPILCLEMNSWTIVRVPSGKDSAWFPAWKILVEDPTQESEYQTILNFPPSEAR